MPRLESCGYKLQDSRDESLSFRRRYLPRAYLTLGLLVLGVSILLINTGPQEPQTGYVIAGWVAIGFMAIYRRHETLSMTIESDGERATVVVLGHLTKKGRHALSALDHIAAGEP